MEPLLFRKPTKEKPTKILRKLLEKPEIIVAPGVFSPISAIIAEN